MRDHNRRFKLIFEFGLGKGVPVSFSPPTTFLSEDLESSKILSLIREDTNWGYFRKRERGRREGDRHPFTQTKLRDEFETPIMILHTYNVIMKNHFESGF